MDQHRTVDTAAACLEDARRFGPLVEPHRAALARGPDLPDELACELKRIRPVQLRIFGQVREDGPVVIAVGRRDIPAPRPDLHAVKPHQTGHPLMVGEHTLSAQFRSNPPIAVGRALVLNSLNERDKRRVVGHVGAGSVVERAPGDLHHAASFGDGEGNGPVITERQPSGAGREACDAFFKSSFSSARRPTIRSRAAMRAS